MTEIKLTIKSEIDGVTYLYDKYMDNVLDLAGFLLQLQLMRDKRDLLK